MGKVPFREWKDGDVVGDIDPGRPDGGFRMSTEFAEWLNEFRDELRRLANLKVPGGGPLRMDPDDAGPRLTLDASADPGAGVARVVRLVDGPNGGVNPYGAVEIRPHPSGVGWVDGPWSCPDCLYELGGLPGLTNKRAWIFPTPGIPGRYHFRHVRIGTGCPDLHFLICGRVFLRSWGCAGGGLTGDVTLTPVPGATLTLQRRVLEPGEEENEWDDVDQCEGGCSDPPEECSRPLARPTDPPVVEIEEGSSSLQEGNYRVALAWVGSSGGTTTLGPSRPFDQSDGDLARLVFDPNELPPGVASVDVYLYRTAATGFRLYKSGATPVDPGDGIGRIDLDAAFDPDAEAPPLENTATRGVEDNECCFLRTPGIPDPTEKPSVDSSGSPSPTGLPVGVYRARHAWLTRYGRTGTSPASDPILVGVPDPGAPDAPELGPPTVDSNPASPGGTMPIGPARLTYTMVDGVGETTVASAPSGLIAEFEVGCADPTVAPTPSVDSGSSTLQPGTYRARYTWSPGVPGLETTASPPSEPFAVDGANPVWKVDIPEAPTNAVEANIYLSDDDGLTWHLYHQGVTPGFPATLTGPFDPMAAPPPGSNTTGGLDVAFTLPDVTADRPRATGLRVYTSTDGGATWHRLDTSDFPASGGNFTIGSTYDPSGPAPPTSNTTLRNIPGIELTETPPDGAVDSLIYLSRGTSTDAVASYYGRFGDLEDPTHAMDHDFPDELPGSFPPGFASRPAHNEEHYGLYRLVYDPGDPPNCPPTVAELSASGVCADYTVNVIRSYPAVAFGSVGNSCVPVGANHYAGLEGATVSIDGVGQTTTNAQGMWCIPIPPNTDVSSLAVTISKARYATRNFTIGSDHGTLGCDAIGFTTPAEVTVVLSSGILLSPDEDHICCSACPRPVSRTWSYADDKGTTTVTLGPQPNGTVGGTAGYTFFEAERGQVQLVMIPLFGFRNCCVKDPGDVNVAVSLSCANGTWFAQVGYPTCINNDQQWPYTQQCSENHPDARPEPRLRGGVAGPFGCMSLQLVETECTDEPLVLEFEGIPSPLTPCPPEAPQGPFTFVEIE